MALDGLQLGTGDGTVEAMIAPVSGFYHISFGEGETVATLCGALGVSDASKLRW